MNLDQALRSLEERIVVPDAPDLVAAVVERIAEPPALPWWRRPAVATAVVSLAVIVAVVGLVPAAREQVRSWLGIGGVEVEVVAPTSTSTSTSTSTPTPTATTTPMPTFPPVPSGLGEGLRLGREIVSLALDQEAGFDVRYPELGLPDRQFVDAEGRVWLLYSTRPGLPELEQVPGVGMIVTQFRPDSPGIVKRVFPEGAEFVETGNLFGLWLPGPHELILPDADGSAVDGRSAGNTLLWEYDNGLTLRIETALTKADAVAIAESFS